MKMNAILKRAAAFVLVVAVLATSAAAATGGTGAAVYSNTLQLSEGFTYTNEISYNSNGSRVESFAVEADTGSGVYPIVLACDTIYGGMSISSVMSYAESLGYNVLGAVNSDFFSTSTKVPIGAVIEDGVYKSSPEGENMLVFGEDGAYVSESPEILVTLVNNGPEAKTEDNSNKGKKVTVSHFNKMRADTGGLYLFTESFSTVSTRSTSAGWAVRFKIIDGDVSVGSELTLMVEEVIENGTSYSIGEGYIVLTAADECGMRGESEKFSAGDIVTMSITASDERLCDAQWATGCGDILASYGKITGSDSWDSSISGYNPRTAVGIKDDGSVIFYVVDGRSSGYSNGAKMSEIATDLLSMGCTWVVNMDGGGSSAIALRLPGSSSAKVVNIPSDGSQRSCSTYILFVTDRPRDGETSYLYLEDDGKYVLQGTELSLGYTASDSGYGRAAVPDDIEAKASLGRIEDGVYYADSAGNDTVTLYSESAGASGTGTFHVISSADTVKVTDSGTGKTPVLSGLREGETVQLAVSVSNYSRDVLFSSGCVSYSVSGNAGTVTEDGLFTAGIAGSEGKLTVKAAGKTFTYEISVSNSFEDISGHWAGEYIEKLYSEGIVNGTGGSSFSPEQYIKRGDFVLMIWRSMGCPKASRNSAFSDVPADSYYAEAIAWAQETGIAQGTGNGIFEPESTLTREQAFTLLYRAFYSDSADGADLSLLEGFSDGDSVSSWAQEPTAFLIERGIVSGSDGSLNPGDQIKRCEMAKILCIALYPEEF